ncbi:putative U-box domain-containing protein 15-like [Capsicum annuum]|nr:putative U-box domain-containing protein 15-like [Capsicum annuum]
MHGLRDDWRGFKREVKWRCFDKRLTIEEMLEKRPTSIPAVHLHQLIEYWKLPEVESKLENRQNARKTPDDAFTAVFGKEKRGRVRGYGSDGSNIPSPDASNTQAIRGKNLSNSSGLAHASVHEKILIIMSSKTNRVEYFIDPNDWFNAKNIYVKGKDVLPECLVFGSCAVDAKEWFYSLTTCGGPLNDTITKPPIPVTPIRNEIKDCIIIDVEDYKATGYSDVLIFVQHTEAMMEEIDRMDEEIEMEDAEDWSVVDIDSSDKKNELTVVEYIDDIYAYYKKAELVIRKKLQLVGITALLLACKYEEVSVPVVEDLVLISEKAYARKEVLEMVELVSFFLTDLCLVEYEMLRFLPSMLATVAVFTAQCTLGVSREWKATYMKHNIYGKNQILPMRLSRSNLQEVDADATIANFNKLKRKAIGIVLFSDCVSSKPAIVSTMILCLFCKSKSKKLPLTN